VSLDTRRRVAVPVVVRAPGGAADLGDGGEDAAPQRRLGRRTGVRVQQRVHQARQHLRPASDRIKQGASTMCFNCGRSGARWVRCSTYAYPSDQVGQKPVTDFQQNSLKGRQPDVCSA